MMTGNDERPMGGKHELAWFRITVVGAAFGVCVGKALVWRHL